MRALIRTWVALVWSVVCCTIGLVVLYGKRSASGWVLHRIGGLLWSRNLLRWISSRPLEIQGPSGIPPTDWFPKRAIYIGNHVSQLDINAVFGAIPHPVVFLAKASIRRIPLLGAVNARAGTVFVERGNKESAVRAAQALLRTLDQGKVVFVFPEGTRSSDGTLQPFKSGAFHLALQAGVPIVPMYIDGTFDMLPKGRLWIREGRVRVKVGVPLEAPPGEGGIRVEQWTSRGRAAIQDLACEA